MFAVKSKANGIVERYKARLVAKGFTQTHGLDNEETFALVAKINSIQVLLSRVVNANWPLYQLDVKNTFLDGDLEQEVFMSLPSGFEEKYGVRKVCKLKISLIDLNSHQELGLNTLAKLLRDLVSYKVRLIIPCFTCIQKKVKLQF